MAVGHINGVTTLTEFSYEKMYGHFVRQKSTGHNNEVGVRQGFTVVPNGSVLVLLFSLQIYKNIVKLLITL